MQPAKPQAAMTAPNSQACMKKMCRKPESTCTQEPQSQRCRNITGHKKHQYNTHYTEKLWTSFQTISIALLIIQELQRLVKGQICQTTNAILCSKSSSTGRSLITVATSQLHPSQDRCVGSCPVYPGSMLDANLDSQKQFG